MPETQKYSPLLTVWKAVRIVWWPAALGAIPPLAATILNDPKLRDYLVDHPWWLLLVFLIGGLKSVADFKAKYGKK